MATVPRGERERQRRPGSRPVLVVADHELFSAALVMALGWRGVRAEAVRPVCQDAILARANQSSAGLVVLDLVLGRDVEGRSLNSCDLMKALGYRGWAVLVVSGVGDERLIAAAIASGACGFVSKSASFDVLFRAIVLAINDETVMSEGERRVWLERHRRHLSRKDELARLLDGLTSRERDVLEKLAQGHRAAAIADKFVVSLATVCSQIQCIICKLGVTSQLEAGALFEEHRNSL